jgi:hypothetical protein
LEKERNAEAQKTNDYWQNLWKKSQIGRNDREANAPDNRVEITLPDGRNIWVTPNEAAQWYKPRADSKAADEWSMNRAVARGKLDEKGEFTNDYSEAATGDMTKVLTPDGKTLVVPWSEYERRTNRQKPVPARPLIESGGKPEVGKPLDQATAKAILAEAGGDKEKARELARQRGYSF